MQSPFLLVGRLACHVSVAASYRATQGVVAGRFSSDLRVAHKQDTLERLTSSTAASRGSLMLPGLAAREQAIRRSLLSAGRHASPVGARFVAALSFASFIITIAGIPRALAGAESSGASPSLEISVKIAVTRDNLLSALPILAAALARTTHSPRLLRRFPLLSLHSPPVNARPAGIPRDTSSCMPRASRDRSLAPDLPPANSRLFGGYRIFVNRRQHTRHERTHQKSTRGPQAGCVRSPAQNIWSIVA
jgi:hypothetical protein